MASLVLGAVGTAIGGQIGGMIGSAAGSVVDSMLIASMQPDQRIEGARLETLTVTSSTEGAVIPRLYGRMRLGGNIIWATDFREETETTSQGGGKGGGGGEVETTEYRYYASLAVALCEGPITGIGRIWADGKPMDLSGVTWRWYPGDEAQDANSFIAAKMGADSTPAYRGTAYVVFEELPLAHFGNRLPQLSFEVFRPLADPDTAEGLTRAVTMIPASGEFTYRNRHYRSHVLRLRHRRRALQVRRQPGRRRRQHQRRRHRAAGVLRRHAHPAHRRRRRLHRRRGPHRHPLRDRRSAASLMLPEEKEARWSRKSSTRSSPIIRSSG